MKRFLLTVLLAIPGATADASEKALPKAVAPDHIGHGMHHTPPGHKHMPHRVGGPRPQDPGFGVHTPPNRHSRGEGNEHDQTHHLLEMHYDEQVMELHNQAKEIHNSHGAESNEAHDHDLKIQKLRNRRKALNFKALGMSDDEYEHLVVLYDELSDVLHKPHTRYDEKEDLHVGDADLQARHEELTKHESLQAQIREIEDHYEHVPHTMNHVGTADERKAMRELYDKIHTTEDRTERKKLRKEYKTRLHHLHDDQRHHHLLSDEERELVAALREELLSLDDDEERQAIRMEIEDIYREHRHAKRLHRRNPHHPNNDADREVNDEIIIALRQKMTQAQTKEERQAIQVQVKDRIHELHWGHVDEDIRPKRRTPENRPKKPPTNDKAEAAKASHPK